MNDLDLSDNVIDVRNIIERVEELESNRDENVSGAPDGTETPDPEGWPVAFPEDAAELKLLTQLLAELAGYGGDEQWRGNWYPLTLIRDTYFTEYAQELAEDCGMVKEGATWPKNCIDWDEAARQLKQDYSTVDVDGTEYFYR